MTTRSISQLFPLVTLGLMSLGGSNCLAQLDQAKIETVVGVFSGRLVDLQGNPVTDAEVSLQGVGYFRSHSDEKGEFTFLDEIPAGEYRLRIESSKWVGITDFRKLPRIIINPDNPARKDFVLQRACQVNLKIVDEKGEPVSAAVYYRPRNLEQYRNADRATTNNEGEVTIGGLEKEAGNYQFGISSKNHALAQAIVEVSDPDEVVNVEIKLTSGQSVTGKAICSDGEPPAGWRIYAMPSWWNFGTYPSGVEIGEDGGFEFPHISDDNYNLLIFIPTGNAMSTSRPVLNDAKLLEMDQPLRVTLDYPSPKSMNYLTGTIRWIGKPLNKAIRITGYCAELKHHTSYHLDPSKTDFKIGPVPSGTYRIRAEHPELETLNLRKIKNLNDLDHVEIPNEKPLQLVLRVRGKPHLQGTVVDAETRKPLPSFRYRITKLQTLSGPNYVQDDQWRLGKSGEFRADVVGPGVYSVSVLAEGYAIQTGPEINTDDQPDDMLSFLMRPGLSLQGRVVDEAGNPVAGATVRALSLTSGAMPRVRSRFVTMEGAVKTEDGHFILENLAPGTESLRVDHPEYAFKTIEGIVVDAGVEPLTIVLSKGATIRGTVFDSYGKPQPNETLLFQDNYAYGGGDREAGTFGTAITDENGNYEINHLPETVVYVSRTEEWSKAGMVRHAVFTKDGETQQLNLGGETELSGQLFANGQPLQNTSLHLGGDDPTFNAMKMFTETDHTGQFTFFGPPAGHWSLYRALNDRGTEWSKIREIEISPEQGLELGKLRLRIGKLRVVCQSTEGPLPENLRLDLRQHSPRHYYGRSAALTLPRDNANDPFLFYNVSPGDYELACSSPAGYTILKRLTLTAEQIDSTIDFQIPTGRETLSLSILDEHGDAATETCTLVSKDERLLIYLYPQLSESPGQYSLEDLPAGSYTLRRGNARNAPIVANIEVEPEVENSVSVEVNEQPMSELGMARLYTFDEQGVYVPCKAHIPEDESGEVKQNFGPAYTYLTGPPGSYAVEIRHPGFEIARERIELIAVDTKDASQSDELDNKLQLRPK